MTRLLLSTFLLILAALPAMAQAPANVQAQRARTINTGGAQGAYHTLFCPPFPPALGRVYFNGYTCTTSRGTLENITRALEAPGAIGFAQLDVYSREAARRPPNSSA